MSGGETVRVGMALEALRRACCADDYSERDQWTLGGGQAADRRRPCFMRASRVA
jgi:hypothetical protein